MLGIKAQPVWVSLRRRGLKSHYTKMRVACKWRHDIVINGQALPSNSHHPTISWQHRLKGWDNDNTAEREKINVWEGNSKHWQRIIKGPDFVMPCDYSILVIFLRSSDVHYNQKLGHKTLHSKKNKKKTPETDGCSERGQNVISKPQQVDFLVFWLPRCILQVFIFTSITTKKSICNTYHRHLQTRIKLNLAYILYNRMIESKNMFRTWVI